MTVRKRFEWKLKSRSLQLGDRTLVMGILNLTPDSFSDGGRYSEPDRAYARALELEEAGADIIDIGAESTKPGSARITEDEEINRLIPVLKRLQGKLTIPISVDTYKAAIAQRALDLGVEIINDPSGLTFEPEIAKVVRDADAGLVLNHMRGTPDSWAKLPPQPDVVGATLKDLDASVNRAIRAGIDRHRIVIDPGLGFGKRKEQNFELIAGLAQFAQLELPILIGPSRKQFLARGTEQETSYANAAAVAAAILNGAHIIRVHEIHEMMIAAQIADSVIVAAPAPVEPERDRRDRDHKRPAMRQEEGRPGNRPLRPPQVRPAVEAAPEATPPPAEAETPTPPLPAERPRNLPLRAAAARPARQEERPPRGERGQERGERGPERGGDRPFRKPREDRGGERPFREDRGGDRPFRKPAGGRGAERPFREDRGQSGERRGGDRPYRPGGEWRDDRRKDDRRGDDRPYRAPRDRQDDRGERPSGPPRGRGGDRPSGPPWARGGAGSSGPSRGRSEGGDRPSGPPRGRSSGDRPSGPPRGRSSGDRPSGPPRGGKGGPPRGGGKSGPPRGKGGPRKRG